MPRLIFGAEFHHAFDPARLYQLRSKITISPAAGRRGRSRWMYIWDFSRSVGAGSAMTRNTRGLTRSVMALIAPLSGAITPLENHAHLQPFVPDPLLEFDQFDVELLEFTLVLLAFELSSICGVQFLFHRLHGSSS